MSQHVGILAVLTLAGAFQRGDRDELAQLAHTQRHALGAALSAPDRATRLAAVAAAPLADNGWELLAPLAELARSRDRREAAAAARAAARIARGLDRRDVIERELPVDLVDERIAAWRGVAADRGRWPDVRVHAMETAARLGEALAADAREAPFDVDAAVRDPEPEVRRAAYELLPIPLPDARAALVRAGVDDPDPAVARAAKQALEAAPSPAPPPPRGSGSRGGGR